MHTRSPLNPAKGPFEPLNPRSSVRNRKSRTHIHIGSEKHALPLNNLSPLSETRSQSTHVPSAPWSRSIIPILRPSGIITRWNYGNSSGIRLLPHLINRNGQLSRCFRIPVTVGLTARLVDYRRRMVTRSFRHAGRMGLVRRQTGRS